MKWIKEVVIKALQILVVIAFVYVMMESWDASVAFNNERIAEYKANHEIVVIERRN